MTLNCYDKNNAKGYLEPNWSRWPIFQERKLNKTISIIKKNVLDNGIEVYFHGKVLRFNCLKEKDLLSKCKFGKFDFPSIFGEHDSKTGEIVLNEVLKYNGARAFSTVYHEYSHEIQRALIKHIDDYPKDSLEYQYLSLLKIEHETLELKAFGIESMGESYIDEGRLSLLLSGLKNSYRSSNLAEAFYALQVCERNAFSTEQDAYNYLVSLDKSKNLMDGDISRQKDSSKIIREEYKAEGLTYDDICILIDNAKMNIVDQKSPRLRNDIEAAITYDMSAFLRLQTATDKTKDLRRNEYTGLMNFETRKKSLETWYKNENKSFVDPCSRERIFSFEFINNIKMQDNFGAEALEKLDAEQQRKNPHLIIAALFFDREEAIPAIKDKQAFRIWYYSDLNNLSDFMKKEISEIMGSDYSLEVWEEKNKKLNWILDKFYPEYDKSTNHDSENYEQDKFRFSQKKVEKRKPDKAKENQTKETDIDR